MRLDREYKCIREYNGLDIGDIVTLSEKYDGLCIHHDKFNKLLGRYFWWFRELHHGKLDIEDALYFNQYFELTSTLKFQFIYEIR